MATLSFKVTRQPAVLVAPSLPTPNEFLYLSNIDDQPWLRFQVPVIQFYQSDSTKKHQNPAKVIKEALAKALVHYYPLAGRLRDAPNGKLMLDCTGEGVLFIEADADVSLQEFGDLIRPFPCWDELLYDVPGSATITNSPILLIQVTRLTCGGFIFALRLNHTVSGAPGLVQFMKALGEIAKGAAQPSVTPVWERERLLPRVNNFAIKYPHYEYEYDHVEDKYGQMVPANEISHHFFFFGLREIAALKQQMGGAKCTTFEVLSAYLWRLRTRALNLPADEEVRLIIPLDARSKIEPPLPSGYYGNAISLTGAKARAADLANRPLSYAVKSIQETKKLVGDEYMRSVINLMELKGRPHLTAIGSFLLSDLTKVGFGEVDFGWGKAVYAGMARSGVGEVPGMMSFLIPLRTKNGFEGIGVSVGLPSAAMQRFKEEMSQAKDYFLFSSL
eukprot:Gb_09067 [translate_table: standard]